MTRLVRLCVGLALLGGPALADCFSEELSIIESRALAGEWKKAQRLAHKLDRKIIFKAEKHSEPCLRTKVARLAALRGITLVALDDLDKGLWLWQGARALDAGQLPNLKDYPAAQALAAVREPAEDRPFDGELPRIETRQSTVSRLLRLTIGSGLEGQAKVTGHLSTEGLPIRVEYQASNALLAYIVIELCSDLPYPKGVTSASCSHSF